MTEIEEKIKKKFPNGLPYQYNIEELAKEAYNVYRESGMTHEAIITKCHMELQEALT